MSVFDGTAKLVAAITLAWVIADASIVSAQQRGSTSGTGSGFGGTTSAGTASTAGRSTGSTASSSMLGGRSTAGGQGANQTGQGVAQPALRTFGETMDQTAAGFGGRGAANAFTGQQLGGQQFGGQQSFGLGGGAQFGGLAGALFGGQAGGRGSTSPGTGQTSTRTRAEQLRPRHRVAFPFSPVSGAQVTANLNTHLRPLQSRMRNAQYSLDAEGTLTLQGTAASIDERELAAAVARLEPGVRRIDNQIVVQQAARLPAQRPGLP